MLDNLLIDRFKILLDTKLFERRKQFPIELWRIDREAAANGGFQSSGRLLQLQ